MAGENITYSPGSIGATQEALSRWILGTEEDLDEIIERLEGKMTITLPDGTKEYIVCKEQRYKKETLIWMRGKLRDILGKHMSLSKYDQNDMYRSAQWTALNFCEELWLDWGKYLDPDTKNAVGQYKELTSLYVNLLDQKMRHPQDGGLREFFANTHQESVQNIMQQLTEKSEKKGLVDRILGK